MNSRRVKTHPAFTLVEAAASVALLAILLGTVIVAFTRTVDNVAARTLDERAIAVAQRRIELLIAMGREPDPGDLQGRDPLDPEFSWRLDLRRIPAVGGRVRADLRNSVIEATVTVEHERDYISERAPFEMTRFFAFLKPLPGQTVAVPVSYEAEPELWYIELQQRLGREPTADEVIREMIRRDLLPPGFMTLLESER